MKTDKKAYIEGEPIHLTVESRWRKAVPEPDYHNYYHRVNAEFPSGDIFGGNSNDFIRSESYPITSHECSGAKPRKRWECVIKYTELPISPETRDSANFAHLLPGEYRFFFDSDRKTRRDAKINIVPVPAELEESWERYTLLRWYNDTDFAKPEKEEPSDCLQQRILFAVGHLHRKPPVEMMMDTVRSICHYFIGQSVDNPYRESAIDLGLSFILHRIRENLRASTDSLLVIEGVRSLIESEAYWQALQHLQRIPGSQYRETGNWASVVEIVDSLGSKKFSKYVRKRNK